MDFSDLYLETDKFRPDILGEHGFFSTFYVQDEKSPTPPSYYLYLQH